MPHSKRESKRNENGHDSWLGEFIDGFREGFGRGSRRLALMVCLSAGLLGGAQAVRAETADQAPFQLAAASSRQIDSDFNHDGKDDLKQMGQGIKDFSKKIDPQAEKLGSVISEKTDQLGQDLAQGSKQVKANVDQKFDEMQNKVNDLNDAERPGSNLWIWLIVALIVVALLAVALAASRRRTVTYYR